MSFFDSNYKKEKYITIIIKRRVGGKKLRNITTGKQTITTRHEYLLTARNERHKNENKGNKCIWQKEKSKKLAPMKLNTRSNRGDEKVKLFSYDLFKKKSQNKGCFLAFYPFLFVKKNKMPDLGSDGWEERKRGGGRNW